MLGLLGVGSGELCTLAAAETPAAPQHALQGHNNSCCQVLLLKQMIMSACCQAAAYLLLLGGAIRAGICC